MANEQAYLRSTIERALLSLAESDVSGNGDGLADLKDVVRAARISACADGPRRPLPEERLATPSQQSSGTLFACLLCGMPPGFHFIDKACR